MAVQGVALYKQYHIDRDDERLGMFQILVDMFGIRRALYPGSFVHIAPSLVIPHVTYVDSFKKTKPFFDDTAIYDYIDSRKEYAVAANVRFIEADFTKSLDLPENSFNLLISQYAGFISHHCKQHLKIGGILLANNSHADAGIAFLDTDYECIGVINKRNNTYIFSDANLSEYFIPKKPERATKEVLFRTMKGAGYTKVAGNYVFKRIG